MLMPFHEAEETVCAECLHEALHCAEPQFQVELGVDPDSVFELRAIVRSQLGAFCFRKIDIWIVEQGGKIVFGKAGSHSLEIDQVSLAVSDDDILRLKIAVHQNSRERRQALCGFLQCRQPGQRRQLCPVDLEVTTEAIFEEITLLPKVKL